MSKDTWLDWHQDRHVDNSVASLAAILKQHGASKILDFGCGTGRHTIYLARLGFDVYGIDWSEKAIEIAKKELSENRLTANLKVWDMIDTPLPFNDSFFDGVIAVRVFHHTFSKKIRLITSEVRRITRKDGYIYVEVPSWRDGEKIQNPDAIEVEPRTLIWSKGKEAHVPHHHFLKSELLELFQDCSVLSLDENNGHFSLTLVRK